MQVYRVEARHDQNSRQQRVELELGLQDAGHGARSQAADESRQRGQQRMGSLTISTAQIAAPKVIEPSTVMSATSKTR